MQEAMKSMLGSKKALATLVGIIVIALAPKIGINQEQVIAILGLLGAYQISQGIADHGKEKAKIEHEHETEGK